MIGRFPLRSGVNKEELSAFEEHKSLAEARAQKEKRESIPLDACFQKYTEREQLGQSELWYCSKCKTHRQVRGLVYQPWREPNRTSMIFVCTKTGLADTTVATVLGFSDGLFGNR